MNNVGIVQYSKNIEKGILEAEWYYLKNGEKVAGTGIVRGEFGDGFEGDFHVSYFNSKGEPTTNFQLKIVKDGDQYLVSWIKDGQVEYIGIGMEKDNALFVGWRKNEKNREKYLE